MRIHHLFKTSPHTKSLRSQIEEVEREMDSLNRSGESRPVIETRLKALRLRHQELDSQAMASAAFDLSLTSNGAELDPFTRGGK